MQSRKDRLGHEEIEVLPMFSMDSAEEEKMRNEEYEEILPVLALKNMVLLPGIILPVTVGRDKSIAAVTAAYKTDKILAVVAQRQSDVEEPGLSDLYETGVVAKIVKLIKMQDGTSTVILQGRRRCNWI